MIRRPPRSTPLYSSAASDVYKRQIQLRSALSRVLSRVLSKGVSKGVAHHPRITSFPQCVEIVDNAVTALHVGTVLVDSPSPLFPLRRRFPSTAPSAPLETSAICGKSLHLSTNPLKQPGGPA